MHRFLGILIVALSNPALAARITVENDRGDCKGAPLSMNVSVTVGEEFFDFNPSCGFSFNQDFKTKNGLTCKVEAGMCSPFTPKKRFEVTCSDGSHKGLKIECDR